MHTSEYVDRHEEILAEEMLSTGSKFQRIKETVKVYLKHCPMCGAPAGITHVNMAEIGDEYVAMKCKACEVMSKPCEEYEEAANLWNRRETSMLKAMKPGIWKCPFCGGKAELETVDEEDQDDEFCGQSRVICSKCGASTQYNENLRKALSVWNRRA